MAKELYMDYATLGVVIGAFLALALGALLWLLAKRVGAETTVRESDYVDDCTRRDY